MKTGFRTISFNRLLEGLVLLVPGMMFLLPDIETNPYMDNTTAWIVMGMSILIVVVIRINQRKRIPLLNIFILNYIGFWHIRYLTLLLYPKYQVVLLRTVIIDHDIFNEYSLLVLLSLAAVFVGIFFAYRLYGNFDRQGVNGKDKFNAVQVNQFVESKLGRIFWYCTAALCIQKLVIKFSTLEASRWLGYLNLMAPMQFIVFLCLLVLLADNVAKKTKCLYVIYLALYVILMVLAGTRSILLHIVIYLFSMFFIYQKDIRFRPRHLMLGLLLIAAMFVSFIFATAQRDFRGEFGFGLNSEVMKFNLERSVETFSSEGGMDTLIGPAVARAGYLDFGAELYANNAYASVVNIANITKSIIDQLIPGSLFEDSLSISQRIMRIYSPSATAYQTDSITAVGENYLLFGYGFPVVIAFVAFVFTSGYLLIGNTVFGIWFKFVLLVNFMFWWNSFGYDWLLLDIVRQGVCGSLLLAMLSYKRKVRLFGYELSSGVMP